MRARQARPRSRHRRGRRRPDRRRRRARDAGRGRRRPHDSWSIARARRRARASRRARPARRPGVGVAASVASMRLHGGRAGVVGIVDDRAPFAQTHHAPRAAPTGRRPASRSSNGRERTPNSSRHRHGRERVRQMRAARQGHATRPAGRPACRGRRVMPSKPWSTTRGRANVRAARARRTSATRPRQPPDAAHHERRRRHWRPASVPRASRLRESRPWRRAIASRDPKKPMCASPTFVQTRTSGSAISTSAPNLAGMIHPQLDDRDVEAGREPDERERQADVVVQIAGVAKHAVPGGEEIRRDFLRRGLAGAARNRDESHARLAPHRLAKALKGVERVADVDDRDDRAEAADRVGHEHAGCAPARPRRQRRRGRRIAHHEARQRAPRRQRPAVDRHPGEDAIRGRRTRRGRRSPERPCLPRATTALTSGRHTRDAARRCPQRGARDLDVVERQRAIADDLIFSWPLPAMSTRSPGLAARIGLFDRDAAVDVT